MHSNHFGTIDAVNFCQEIRTAYFQYTHESAINFTQNLKHLLMKKLTTLLLVILVGCTDQNAIQKTTLSQAGLREVLKTSSDFHQLVDASIKRSEELIKSFQKLTEDEQAIITGLNTKYKSGEDFLKFGTVDEKNLITGLTTTKIGDFYINLVNRLSEKYVFQTSDLNQILADSAMEKRANGTANGRSSVLVGCASNCQNSADLFYYQSYGWAISAGYGYVQADMLAQMMADSYLLGCLRGCSDNS